MAAGNYANGLNTVIPLFEASGNLQVEFARNPKSFALNQYSSRISAPTPRGTYLYFNPNDAVRVLGTKKWAYGTPRPAGFQNQQGFTVKNFFCERYTETTTLDKFSVDVGSFDVQAIHTRRLAAQLMINRTNVSVAKMIDTTQYPAANVFATATAAGAGGSVYAGTTADPRLFKLLSGAAQIIQKATGGRVRVGELGFICNQVTAQKLSLSREIREYVMQQPTAYQMVTGEKNALMSAYLLPDQLYRFNVAIEDTFINLGNQDSTADVNTNCFPDNTIIVYVREGGLEAQYGAGGYSTYTHFVYDDMNAKAVVDDWNQLVQLAVDDNFDFQVTAPVTGVIIQDVSS